MHESCTWHLLNRRYIENLLHFCPNNSRTLWVKIIWIKIQTFLIITLHFSWQTVLWTVRLSPGTHAWFFKGWSAYPKLCMLHVQTKASAYQNNQTSREYRQRPSPGQIRVFEQGLRNMLRKWISELHRSRKRHKCFVHTWVISIVASFSEKGSHCVAQASLELKILPLSPELQDCKPHIYNELKES